MPSIHCILHACMRMATTNRIVLKKFKLFSLDIADLDLVPESIFDYFEIYNILAILCNVLILLCHCRLILLNFHSLTHDVRFKERCTKVYWLVYFSLT